ncbi:hypothetical protein [Aureimonas mangrovi]|uniref:hypothetical protein n=1 Tax=Aureimonas mangrovi TaxID=2758041 RepID=UPI00163D753B|nr:hypothetical protein [Aureimonas mangrovi]
MSDETDRFLVRLRERCPRLRTHLVGFAAWEIEAVLAAAVTAIDAELDRRIEQQILQSGGS